MRNQIIEQLRSLGTQIRELPDLTHEDRKAAQSASQAAASLEEAVLKLDTIRRAAAQESTNTPSAPPEQQAGAVPAQGGAL